MGKEKIRALSVDHAELAEGRRRFMPHLLAGLSMDKQTLKDFLKEYQHKVAQLGVERARKLISHVINLRLPYSLLSQQAYEAIYTLDNALDDLDKHVPLNSVFQKLIRNLPRTFYNVDAQLQCLSNKSIAYLYRLDSPTHRLLEQYAYDSDRRVMGILLARARLAFLKDNACDIDLILDEIDKQPDLTDDFINEKISQLSPQAVAFINSNARVKNYIGHDVGPAPSLRQAYEPMLSFDPKWGDFDRIQNNLLMASFQHHLQNRLQSSAARLSDQDLDISSLLEQLALSLKATNDRTMTRALIPTLSHDLDTMAINPASHLKTLSTQFQRKSHLFQLKKDIYRMLQIDGQPVDQKSEETDQAFEKRLDEILQNTLGIQDATLRQALLEYTHQHAWAAHASNYHTTQISTLGEDILPKHIEVNLHKDANGQIVLTTKLWAPTIQVIGDETAKRQENNATLIYAYTQLRFTQQAVPGLEKSPYPNIQVEIVDSFLDIYNADKLKWHDTQYVQRTILSKLLHGQALLSEDTAILARFLAPILNHNLHQLLQRSNDDLFLLAAYDTDKCEALLSHVAGLKRLTAGYDSTTILTRLAERHSFSPRIVQRVARLQQFTQFVREKDYTSIIAKLREEATANDMRYVIAMQDYHTVNLLLAIPGIRLRLNTETIGELAKSDVLLANRLLKAPPGLRFRSFFSVNKKSAPFVRLASPAIADIVGAHPSLWETHYRKQRWWHRIFSTRPNYRLKMQRADLWRLLIHNPESGSRDAAAIAIFTDGQLRRRFLSGIQPQEITALLKTDFSVATREILLKQLMQGRDRRNIMALSERNVLAKTYLAIEDAPLRQKMEKHFHILSQADLLAPAVRTALEALNAPDFSAQMAEIKRYVNDSAIAILSEAAISAADKLDNTLFFKACLRSAKASTTNHAFLTHVLNDKHLKARLLRLCARYEYLNTLQKTEVTIEDLNQLFRAGVGVPETSAPKRLKDLLLADDTISDLLLTELETADDHDNRLLLLGDAAFKKRALARIIGHEASLTTFKQCPDFTTDLATLFVSAQPQMLLSLFLKNRDLIRTFFDPANLWYTGDEKMLVLKELLTHLKPIEMRLLLASEPSFFMRMIIKNNLFDRHKAILMPVIKSLFCYFDPTQVAAFKTQHEAIEEVYTALEEAEEETSKDHGAIIKLKQIKDPGVLAASIEGMLNKESVEDAKLHLSLILSQGEILQCLLNPGGAKLEDGFKHYNKILAFLNAHAPEHYKTLCTQLVIANLCSKTPYDFSDDAFRAHLLAGADLQLLPIMQLMPVCQPRGTSEITQILFDRMIEAPDLVKTYVDILLANSPENAFGLTQGIAKYEARCLAAGEEPKHYHDLMARLLATEAFSGEAIGHILNSAFKHNARYYESHPLRRQLLALPKVLEGLLQKSHLSKPNTLTATQMVALFIAEHKINQTDSDLSKALETQIDYMIDAASPKAIFDLIKDFPASSAETELTMGDHIRERLFEMLLQRPYLRNRFYDYRNLQDEIYCYANASKHQERLARLLAVDSRYYAQHRGAIHFTAIAKSRVTPTDFAQMVNAVLKQGQFVHYLMRDLALLIGNDSENNVVKRALFTDPIDPSLLSSLLCHILAAYRQPQDDDSGDAETTSIEAESLLQKLKETYHLSDCVDRIIASGKPNDLAKLFLHLPILDKLDADFVLYKKRRLIEGRMRETLLHADGPYIEKILACDEESEILQMLLAAIDEDSAYGIQLRERFLFNGVLFKTDFQDKKVYTDATLSLMLALAHKMPMAKQCLLQADFSLIWQQVSLATLLEKMREPRYAFFKKAMLKHLCDSVPNNLFTLKVIGCTNDALALALRLTPKTPDVNIALCEKFCDEALTPELIKDCLLDNPGFQLKMDFPKSYIYYEKCLTNRYVLSLLLKQDSEVSHSDPKATDFVLPFRKALLAHTDTFEQQKALTTTVLNALAYAYSGATRDVQAAYAKQHANVMQKSDFIEALNAIQKGKTSIVDALVDNGTFASKSKTNPLRSRELRGSNSCLSPRRHSQPQPLLDEITSSRSDTRVQVGC